MEKSFLATPEIIPAHPVNGVCPDKKRFITDTEFIKLEHQLSVAEKAHELLPSFNPSELLLTHAQAEKLTFYFIDNAFVKKLNKLRTSLMQGVHFPTPIYAHEIPL